jgi:hypothetical protein
MQLGLDRVVSGRYCSAWTRALDQFGLGVTISGDGQESFRRAAEDRGVKEVAKQIIWLSVRRRAEIGTVNIQIVHNLP